MRVHVIYGSHYGHSQRYATWIAEDVTARGDEALAFDAADYTPRSSNAPDALVYVAGNYGGPLAHAAEFVAAAHAYPNAQLFVVSVSWASPRRTDDIRALHEKNVPADLRPRTQFFHARGGLEHSKLSFKHKGIMTAVRGFMLAKPESKRDPDETQMLELWGTDTDFTSRDQIAPVVDAISGKAPAQQP